MVLGWDPAFRTGCKLAVVDETGKVLDTTVIYPTAPQNRVEESKADREKADPQVRHFPDLSGEWYGKPENLSRSSWNS